MKIRLPYLLHDIQAKKDPFDQNLDAIELEICVRIGHTSDRVNDLGKLVQKRAVHQAGFASTTALAEQRLGLGPHEVRVVWLLAAFELRLALRSMLISNGLATADGPHLTFIRTLCYGSEASVTAQRELGATGVLVDVLGYLTP